jgi:DNA-binding transcriptional regulator GbsR (MarR family)
VSHYTELSEIFEDSERGGPTITDSHDVAEELALVMSTHGMQRMTARVLAALLFTDQPTMTAGELGERLQASSGAISGAIKMLTSVGLVERVPAPASRRDHYRLRDNAWAIQYTNQNEVTTAVLKAAEAGIAATDDGSLAHQRLTQMRDFYNFLMEEIPALLERWYRK